MAALIRAPPRSFMSFFITDNIPRISASVLLLVESARVIPAEYRMWTRAWARKRLNAAEMMFLLIRYLALAGTIAGMLLISEAQVFHTSLECAVTSWFSQLTSYICCSIVAASLIWRCHIIMARQRRVLYILLAALVVHVGISLWCGSVQYKADKLYVEKAFGNFPRWVSCDSSSGRKAWIPVWKLSSFWFYLMNVVFDLSIFAASSYRLLKHARGPTGFARTSALLFGNGVHYCFMICSINLTTFILICHRTYKLPNMLPMSTALTIICGMQLLVSEQDAVHGFKGVMSTMIKPATHSSGPMTGSMSQSSESKNTLLTRSHPNSDMLRSPAKSSSGRKAISCDDDDDEYTDMEKGYANPKVSFGGSITAQPLLPLDPCWTVGQKDANGASSLPRTPQSGGTYLSIREIRERMQEQQATTEREIEQFGGRTRTRAPSIPPVPRLSPMNPHLTIQPARSQSLNQQRPKTAKSESDVTDASLPLSPFPAPPSWSREPTEKDGSYGGSVEASTSSAYLETSAPPAILLTPRSDISAAPSYSSVTTGEERFSSTWSIVNPSHSSTARSPRSPQRTRTSPCSSDEAAAARAGWGSFHLNGDKI